MLQTRAPNAPTGNQPTPVATQIVAAKPQAFVSNPTAGESQTPLPFWIESAIRMGVRFYRIAAGGVPPAAAPFRPTDFHAAKTRLLPPLRLHDHPPLVDEYYFWLVECALYAGEVSPADYEIEPDPQDPASDQTAEGPTSQTSTTWHDPTRPPKMLAGIRNRPYAWHGAAFTMDSSSNRAALTHCVVVPENTTPRSLPTLGVSVTPSLLQ